MGSFLSMSKQFLCWAEENGITSLKMFKETKYWIRIVFFMYAILKILFLRTNKNKCLSGELKYPRNQALDTPDIQPLPHAKHWEYKGQVQYCKTHLYTWNQSYQHLFINMSLNTQISIYFSKSHSPLSHCPILI